MPRGNRPSVTRVFSLFALIAGYSVLGGLLAAFSAGSWVWLGTGVMVLHLVKSGLSAIVLANAWILLITAIAVVQKTWPLFLFGYLPRSNASLWAVLMIGFWFYMIGLAFLLGATSQRIQRLGFRPIRTYGSLASITILALGIGGLVIRVTFFT
ncbi:MAG: hypothetical protein ACFBSC_22615 [Microcoleaceae cyanobacterium]